MLIAYIEGDPLQLCGGGGITACPPTHLPWWWWCMTVAMYAVSARAFKVGVLLPQAMSHGHRHGASWILSHGLLHGTS